MTRFPIMNAIGLAASIACFSGYASAQLLGHGPLHEHGYPSYYVDTAGTTLTHCYSPTDPHCFNDVAELPHGGAMPLNIGTGEFWHESFYWACIATHTFGPPGGAGREINVMFAVYGSWGNASEEIEPGGQVVVSRIRFRVDGMTPGNYTILHPYGEETFMNVGVGRRAINYTQDCLHSENPFGEIIPTCGEGVGNDFSTGLTPGLSRVDRFLYWDPAIEPQAPAGYMGDPLVMHRVTGSSNGRNEVTIIGPDVGGPGIHQFVISEFMVVGKYGAPASLTSEPRYMDTSVGGTQTLHLDAGMAHADQGYFVLSSLGGALSLLSGNTSPGIELGNGLRIPLKLDGLLALGLQPGGNPWVTGFAGQLDSLGQATATLTLPRFPELLGSELFHAYCTGPAGQITHVSNNTTISFQ